MTKKKPAAKRKAAMPRKPKLGPPWLADNERKMVQRVANTLGEERTREILTTFVGSKGEEAYRANFVRDIQELRLRLAQVNEMASSHLKTPEQQKAEAAQAAAAAMEAQGMNTPNPTEAK